MAAHPRTPDLTWLPLAEEHVPAWHRLLEVSTAADDGDEHLTQDDLHDELAPSYLDLAVDSVIGLDAAGVARAFGLVTVRPGDVHERRAFLWGAVDPEHRGRGLGREVLRWQLERAAERRADAPAGVPVRAYVSAKDSQQDVVRLLERGGFDRARYFFTMRRPLDVPLPQVPAVPGVRVVPFSDALSEPVRLTHNVAFAEHWGSQPWSVEDWKQWAVENRWFRGDWSLVALADGPDGPDAAGGPVVVGYALSMGYEPDWEPQGFSEGYVAKLGVLPGWRGRGLAKLLLAASMQRFAADGLDRAGLDVDSENGTGAVGLYTALGFEVTTTSASWRLDLT